MAYLSQLNVNNSDYDLKDTEARNDLQSTQTVSGNPLTLTDCAPINAESLVVELEPKQDLHGQSAPYVGGAGKNKLPMTVEGIKAANTSGTWSGNVYSINNGTFTVLTDSDGNVTGIKVNGPFSATSILYLYSDLSDTLSNGTGYILNGCSGGGFSTYKLDITNQNGTSIVINTDGDGSFTMDSYKQVRIVVYSGVNPNTTIYPQIRLATESDSTFAPYSNICPITGYTEVGVEDVGKNLVDISQAETITTPQNTQRNGLYINVKGNGQNYVLSRSGGNAAYISYINSNGNWQQAGVSGQTNSFSFQSYGNQICINAGEGGLLSNTYSLQLEEGQTATPYEPYHSSNATIQFGQTVYGGVVDFKTGVMTVDKVSKTFVGGSDEAWTTSSSWTVGAYYLANAITDAVSVSGYDTVANIISNLGSIQTPSNLANNTAFGVGQGNGSSIYVRFDNSLDTVAKLKTYLSNNNLQVCYELATPFTIQLTPDELKLLKGTNNLSADGVMQIGYQPDNVIGELKGEIEQHLEMPWVKVIDNNTTIDFEDIAIEDGQEYTYTLADNEFFKHRFVLLEVYEVVLWKTFVSASALLSIDTLLEFSTGEKVSLGYLNHGEGVFGNVWFNIYDDDGTYKIWISFDSTSQSQLNNYQARARYVD